MRPVPLTIMAHCDLSRETLHPSTNIIFLLNKLLHSMFLFKRKGVLYDLIYIGLRASNCSLSPPVCLLINDFAKGVQRCYKVLRIQVNNT